MRAIALALSLSLAACDAAPEDTDALPGDVDGDGHAAPADCDDADPAVHPGAAETCATPGDDDCDGEAQEAGATGCADLYADADGDGHGVGDASCLCAPTGDFTASAAGDCDDADPEAFPGAEEVWYDGVDQDCAGGDDDDADGDGHRAVARGGDDCDDADAAVFPGAADAWYDGVDSDCAGNSDWDADGDGEDVPTAGGRDCDDSDAEIGPHAEEIPQDGTDQDCDGLDGGWPIDELGRGDVVITEIMADPTAAQGQWVEILIVASGTYGLQGLVLEDAGGATATVEASLLAGEGDRVVLGASTDVAVNGGADVDAAWTSLELDLADEIALVAGTTTLDRVEWGDGWAVEAGASLGLHEDYEDHRDNDDAWAWCAATSAYGDGDLGTPGDANDACYTYTHAVDVQAVWTASCASCHAGGAPSGDLDLSGDAWGDLVDVPSSQLATMDLVEPGSPSTSYLYLKITGAHLAAGGSGSTMPRSGSISSADVALVRTWIEEGAPR